MWHEERLHGPSGPPAGHTAEAEQRTITPSRNPLFWGMWVAIVLLLPPYRLSDPLDVMLRASAIVFLAFYFARSRYAWHALAAHIVVVTPVYALLSFSWRLQRALHPWIIWVPIVGTVLGGLLLLWSRKRYVGYLEHTNERAVDERI